MKIATGLIIAALGAGAANAQHILPLGAPIIPQPKTAAAPPPSSQLSTGRMKAAAPLGSNYSPYNIQPQASVTAAAPSAMPDEKPVASGVVNDPNVLATLPDPTNAGKTTRAGKSGQQSDMQKLAPQSLERTQMPAADAPVPR